jgi:hypothetical protein
VRTLLWTTAGLLGAVLVTNVPAGAHHASAPFYDPEKQVEAVGTVTEFVFRNPHSFVYLDAPNADGDVVGWEVEMGTAVMMTRRGWTSDTIKAGDEIRVVGQPSRAPGTYGICCAELTRPDGSSIRP